MIDPGGGATTKAEDAQGTPTQSHVSPNILAHEDYSGLSETHLDLIRAKEKEGEGRREVVGSKVPLTPNSRSQPQTQTLDPKSRIPWI